MIIYFSGTGNSLYVSRKIGEALGEQVMPMAEAVGHDLTKEERIGLVYPSYDFAPPPAVQRMIPLLQISPKAYVFIIITCGAQAGVSSWYAKKLLKQKGIRVEYCHKIRMPDCAGIAYGRNPNKQTWKFRRYASRLDRIIADVKARRTAYHFSGWSFMGWLSLQPSIGRKMIKPFIPAVNAINCVGCRTCEHVCPIGNIVMKERSNTKLLAHIGTECTACLSCVHFCPHQAIELGGKHLDKSWQYHHPEVKLKDMFH